MHLLYNEGSIICKLEKQFCKFFSKETKPTQRHLLDMILSVLVLNGFQSVKFNYEHFINETTDFSLNSYYFTLNKSKIDLGEWQRNIIQTLKLPTAKVLIKPIKSNKIANKKGTAAPNMV